VEVRVNKAFGSRLSLQQLFKAFIIVIFYIGLLNPLNFICIWPNIKKNMSRMRKCLSLKHVSAAIKFFYIFI